MNDQEVRRQRERCAKEIDPRKAILTWGYGQILDPYGENPDLPEECYQIGRIYFLYDPDVRGGVLEGEVRELHREIADAEWRDLMRLARERDPATDPFPQFDRFPSEASGGTNE